MLKKNGIEDVKEILEKRNYKLLTTEYKTQYDKLDVICDKGHLYHPTSKSVRKGSGCGICYNNTENRHAAKFKPDKLQDLIQIAKSYGGECLSSEYYNNKTKLKFKCKKGHEWETTSKSIKSGSWCPLCAINFTQLNSEYNNLPINDVYKDIKIQKAKDIAEQHGGEFISCNDKNVDMITWKCAFNHIWNARFGNVSANDSWCPFCESNYSENICRQYLEYLLTYKFIKVRPKWLLSDKNSPMELDGYCEELSLAFEHQGIQHYKNITFFKNDLENIVKRDNLKIEKCNKNNVKLIVIPSLFSLIKIEDLHIFLGEQLDKLNIKYNINKLKPVNEVLKLKIIKNLNYTNELEKITEIAKSHDGYCLSDLYTGYNCILKFKCKLDHIWETEARLIKNGSWCPMCSIAKVPTIQDIKELAKTKNGELLSTVYVNNHTKLDWQCACGKIWQASYNSIQSGCWCPVCSIKIRSNKKRISIDAYKKAAEIKGGKCLSEKIDSCYDKLEFECGFGHRWFARADITKNTKRWCPFCSKKEKE
jgi:hypothetical protein